MQMAIMKTETHIKVIYVYPLGCTQMSLCNNETCHTTAYSLTWDVIAKSLEASCVMMESGKEPDIFVCYF